MTRNTQFAVTIPMTVEAFDRNWDLIATVTPLGFDCTPAILWLENKDKATSPWVPELVWEAAEEALVSGPARELFDAAMGNAEVPFLAAAE
jgi:hypothetical protein